MLRYTRLKFVDGCSASASNVTVKFWQIKVKIQGQNRRSGKSFTNNSLAVVLAIITKFGILTEVIRDEFSRFALSECF